MNHTLKIESSSFNHIQEGKKTFEVRYNDRDYQVGDTISFEILEDEVIPSEGYQKYHIVYVHHGLGMIENYVVLAIEELEEDYEEDEIKKERKL